MEIAIRTVELKGVDSDAVVSLCQHITIAARLPDGNNWEEHSEYTEPMNIFCVACKKWHKLTILVN